MNVQRCTDGKLRPAQFPSVLGLPYPVARIVKVVPMVHDDPWAPNVHSTHRLVYDTDTDFHDQRMRIVR